MEPLSEEIDQLGTAVKSRFVEFLKLFSSEADQAKDDYSLGGAGGDMRRDYLEILMDMKTRDSTTIFVDFVHVQEYAPHAGDFASWACVYLRRDWQYDACRRVAWGAGCLHARSGRASPLEKRRGAKGRALDRAQERTTKGVHVHTHVPTIPHSCRTTWRVLGAASAQCWSARLPAMWLLWRRQSL
jgi:hypothetical protein